MRTGLWIGKALVLWIALTVGLVLGGLLTAGSAPPAAGDGPLSATQAMPVVNAIMALALAVLSERLDGSRARRAFVAFAVLFGVETLLSLIEAAYFNQYLGLSRDLLAAIAVMGAVKCLLAGAAVGALWRASPLPRFEQRGLVWKLATIVPVYIVAYFAAGALIAWQSPAVRAYYEHGLHIDQAQLTLLQVGRGAVWAVLAYLLARHLRGSPVHRALVTGLCFAVFMAAPLLFPTGFMPWPVRSMHMLEIGASNFLFGVFATLLLTTGGGRRGPSEQRLDAAQPLG